MSFAAIVLAVARLANKDRRRDARHFESQTLFLKEVVMFERAHALLAELETETPALLGDLKIAVGAVEKRAESALGMVKTARAELAKALVGGEPAASDVGITLLLAADAPAETTSLSVKADVWPSTGAAISHDAIAPGTTITGVDQGAGTVTLSLPTVAALAAGAELAVKAAS